LATFFNQTFCHIFILCTLTACAAPPVQTSQYPVGTGQLELNFSGFRNNQGEALVYIYPDALGFPDAEAPNIIRIHKPIQNQRVHFTLEKIPFHAYAIGVLHDENLNGHMDKSLLGFPREGFGFSRNPEPLFGPPKFEKAQFLVVTEHQSQAIKLQYPKKRKLRSPKAHLTPNG
jgi:uncharacterized protein (DUF2141 family)